MMVQPSAAELKKIETTDAPRLPHGNAPSPPATPEQRHRFSSSLACLADDTAVLQAVKNFQQRPLVPGKGVLLSALFPGADERECFPLGLTTHGGKPLRADGAPALNLQAGGMTVAYVLMP